MFTLLIMILKRPECYYISYIIIGWRWLYVSI